MVMPISIPLYGDTQTREKNREQWLNCRIVLDAANKALDEVEAQRDEKRMLLKKLNPKIRQRTLSEMINNFRKEHRDVFINILDKASSAVAIDPDCTIPIPPEYFEMLRKYLT